MARKSVSVHAERFALQDIHSGCMVAYPEVILAAGRLPIIRLSRNIACAIRAKTSIRNNRT
jgi:hypothetical protein